MYTTDYMEKLEKTPVVSMTGRLSLVSAGDVCVRKLQHDWPIFKLQKKISAVMRAGIIFCLFLAQLFVYEAYRYRNCIEDRL